MCEMISFIYKYEDSKIDIKVYDLMSHSDTQKYYPELTENLGWYEGHYTTKKIECRIPQGRNEDAEKQLKYDYPTFIDFVKYCLKQEISGDLDLGDCDLTGIELPKEISGFLNLRNCKNLTGIELPEKIGGNLNLSYCKNLTGIELPKEINGYLDLSNCDLTGIELPEKIGNSLYLSNCDLTGIKLPKEIGGGLYLRGCDLTNIDIPENLKDKVIK